MSAIAPSIVMLEADGLRRLHFGSADGWCQGAMRLDAPHRLELAYAVRMCAWLLFHEPASLPGKHLLTLGLGAGTLTRFAHRVLGLQATAVEIDADVINACRTHFLLPADGAGLRVVQAEGADFMAQAAQGTPAFDLVQVDAYDAAVERPALDSEAFYADCAAALRPGGTLMANLVGARMDARQSVARLRAQLQPSTVWQFPPTDAGNVVVLAHCGPVPAEDVLTARAAEIERRWDLPAPAWLAMARRTVG